MINEPTGHEQPNRQKDSQIRQPVFPSPPQREQEANTQCDTRNLACHYVEAAEDKERADEGGTEVASGKCDDIDTTAHVCDAAFTRVEGNGFDTATGAAGSDSMGEFMERNNEHLVVEGGVSAGLRLAGRLGLP